MTFAPVNPCNRSATNAPIICSNNDQVAECAEAFSVPPSDIYNIDPATLTTEQLVEAVAEASRRPWWVVVDADLVSNDALRDIVHRVWLKGNWVHHEGFRCWMIWHGASVEATCQVDLSPSRMRALAEASDTNNDAAAAAAVTSSSNDSFRLLPPLLATSCVYLKYTNNFAAEFAARDLVSAVEEGNLNRTIDNSASLQYLAPDDHVDLFRKAQFEDVFLALVQGPVVERSRPEQLNFFLTEMQRDKVCPNHAIIANIRDSHNFSPLDAAIDKDFLTGARLLCEIGCQTERLQFDRLLEDSFKPMLEAILDPWRQFPFDPVKSASVIVLSARIAVLRKLFECRVDCDFQFHDYPLAEAAYAGDTDQMWVVVDRMGNTGVHPFTDERIASHFLKKILLFEPEQKSKKKQQQDGDDAATAAATDDVCTKPLNEVSLFLLNKLADAVYVDCVRVNIPLKALKRCVAYPDLMRKILLCVDVEQEHNTLELLMYFIHFDPTNDVSRRITLRAVDEIGIGGGEETEMKFYALFMEMMAQGEVAAPMIRWGMQLAIKRDGLCLPRRNTEEGLTLLMQALLMHPIPNVEAMKIMVECAPNSIVRKNTISQVDFINNNALVRAVITIVHAPQHYAPYLPKYADGIHVLIKNGIDTSVKSPAFPSSLFMYAARQELGEVCFELLSTRIPAAPAAATSLITSCTANLIALMAVRQGRICGEMRDKTRLAFRYCCCPKLFQRVHEAQLAIREPIPDDNKRKNGQGSEDEGEEEEETAESVAHDFLQDVMISLAVQEPDAEADKKDPLFVHRMELETEWEYFLKERIMDRRLFSNPHDVPEAFKNEAFLMKSLVVLPPSSATPAKVLTKSERHRQAVLKRAELEGHCSSSSSHPQQQQQQPLALIDVQLLSRILSFLTIKELGGSASSVSAAWYYASLMNSSWEAHVPRAIVARPSSAADVAMYREQQQQQKQQQQQQQQQQNGQQEDKQSAPLGSDYLIASCEKVRQYKRAHSRPSSAANGGGF